MSSTETGAIFGNIVYESGNDRRVIVLNDVHIDIMDYISPASCADVQFRSMWAEFEWENKVGHSNETQASIVPLILIDAHCVDHSASGKVRRDYCCLLWCVRV